MPSERLARSGVVSLVGSAFAALAALALTSVVGNTLGPTGTGIFFQAVGIFTILTQVLRLGTNSGIVRFVSEQRAFDRRGAEWKIIGFAALPVALLGAAGSFVLWAFADNVASVFAAAGEQESLAGLFRAMAPFVVVGSLIGVAQIAARMLRGVTAFTWLQSVLLPLSRVVAVTSVALLLSTSYAAVEAWLWPLPLWLLVTLLVISAPLVRDFRHRRETERAAQPTFGRFWRFNAPRAVSSGLEVALEWADVLIVAALASPAAAGIYAVATRTVRAGGVVDKAMRVAVAPRTSELLARGETHESSQLHTRVVRIMLLMNWPFYLLLVSMGGSVLLLFGEEFVAGWGPMAALAVAMMFQTASGMLQSLLLQGGRSSWQMYNKAIALTLSIVGNLVLVPPLGLWGAAITWLVVMVADNLIAAFQVHRLMHVHLRPAQLLLAALVPLLVFGVGGAAVSWWAGVGLVALISAAAGLSVLYAAALWALRHRLEIENLWRKVPVIGRYA